MEFHYSSDRNVQMLIYLLKENNIKKIIISPGTTNIPFVASVQQDDYFETYSAVDERGAAYMACGMAYESSEPVVITCTGATASRNYMPGLSEAFYRKLPILAVTGAHDYSNAGNLFPQFIDRSAQPKDIVKLSVSLEPINSAQDEWACNLKLNKALLELRRNGGGPVHINLTAMPNSNFEVRELPKTRVIKRYTVEDDMPELAANKKIAISVGAHMPWSSKLTELVEAFCSSYDAIVLTDHSSGYKGVYSVNPAIATSQERYVTPITDIDLLIHIGEHSGDYYTYYSLMRVKEVWRISKDGELRDTFKQLTKLFDMSEERFFDYYVHSTNEEKAFYLNQSKNELESIYNNIPELPFSNIWLAKTIAPKIPENSAVHLGVSNTMRSWTFFEFPKSVMSIANVGCRGIDGSISTALGMSLANKDKLHYCILGDLTFFYNLNALANRQLGSNLRVLLINNGRGTEFKLYPHVGRRMLDEAVDPFVAAAGHNGKQSPTLVKHFSEDLGFTYLSASSKDEALSALDVFLNDKITDKPMLFEVFTDSENENLALKLIRNICTDPKELAKAEAKRAVKDKVKNILGDNITKKVKDILIK